MKTTTQLFVSAAAAAALAFVAAAHATNLAELPLKVSALAKPNVIFGMDDSGSMDWETVLRTHDGLVWWDGTAATGTSWDTVNNRPLEISTTFNPMSYLFPLGTATGAALYGSGHPNGRGIPPIAQLAWARSSAFNPLYYNTTVTYAPWSKAYVDGAERSYANAPTGAAPSHPAVAGAPTLNVGANWDSGNPNWTTTDFRFRVLAGMALPVGTRVVASTSTSGICSGTTEQTLTAVTVVPNGASCRASIPYYPATFWQRTVCPVGDTSCVPAPDCTAEDPKANPTASCIAAPDGVGKLRRYEIKVGNTFPSGRTHAEELQNFANWFTYYRKRKLMLAGAMGQAMEPITGMRLGVVPFNNRGTVTMWDADGTNPASNKLAAAGRFYVNGMSPVGTPTHATMQHIGNQFNTNTSIIQYACQRNSMFVVTDGFANAHSITTPSYTAAPADGAPPFATTHANSLADLALAYYRIRPRTDLPAGLVPPGDPNRKNPITNTNLHVTTYAITLGARGSLYPTASNPFAVDVFANPPTWPTPVADSPTMIDDLWHATVNGRGLMYLANEAKAMGRAIQESFNDILSQEGSQASIGVSSVNLGRGDDNAYLGVYNVRGWTGDLTRNQVNSGTGEVTSTQTWPKSAAAQLAERAWTGRLVFTSNDTSGLDISDAGVAAIVGSTAKVNWIRGDRSAEGTSLRARPSLIGAVINAEPVVARGDKVVYLASGEGLLHAFDSDTGAELWAYHPAETLAAAGASAERGWVFRTLLDATPTFAQTSTSSKLLVGGLGAAGRSYYALDVSNPRPANLGAATGLFKWRFPKASDTTNAALMGYTVGSPVVAKVGTSHKVLVTSGYDNGLSIGDGQGRLWMLNAETGAVEKTFVTTAAGVSAGDEAGLAFVSAFRELDGTTRYVYGGDLKGNLWRFDLATGGAGPHAGALVATLRDGSGNAQPVTSAPELIWMSGKRVILIGTGRLLDLDDLGSKTTRQSFYAIADGATLTNARTGLVARSYVAANETGSTTSTPLTGADFDWNTQRGWYFDLPVDEHANTNPVVTYGAVVFVTNKQGSSDCSQFSYLYLVDIGSGKKSPDSTFVKTLISDRATSSRVITLRTVNGKIVGTTHKSDNSVYQRELPLGMTIPPSKNAWRELRR